MSTQDSSKPRLTARDFYQELIDLYGYYAHGQIDRRAFFSRRSWVLDVI